jgi:predicted ATPase
MKAGFRVIEFSPKGFMGKNDINVIFHEDEETINTGIFSCALIIGENGSGKTELAIRLLDVFSEIENIQLENNVRNSNNRMQYKLKYYLNGRIFDIESDKEYIFRKDGQVVDISEIELPNKYLAQSFSFADKFNYSSGGRYSYLGTRTASNASYISHIQNSITEIISTKIEEEDFIDFFRLVLNFLKFDEKLEIMFEIKSIKSLLEILNDKEIFESKYKDLKSNRRISSQVYLSNTNIESVHERINELINRYRKNKKVLSFMLDLNEDKKYDELKDFFVFMRLLSYMRVLSIPMVNFYKHQTELSINTASSGEKQIIYSMLNIYSVIKPNSLVIIDEPEISLHPNWQMKYMKLLEMSFNKYTNSHFIIATHSHFMVSDLKKENSSVIVMNRSTETYSAVTYKSDTYSWSAEDILYNVFSVPSSRNYYIASDVEEVIKAISTQKISEEIIAKINTFEKILPNLKNADPLKTIIEKILERDMV